MNHFLENMLIWPDRQRHKIKQADTKEILVIRLDAIGDMLITVPFFCNLRAAYPEHKITLVCSDFVYNLVETMPYVDEVIAYKIIKGKHSFWKNRAALKEFADKNFGKRSFELAIIPSYQAKGIELILASNVQAARLVAFRDGKILGTECTYKEEPMHEVPRCLKLLQALNLPVGDDRLEIFADEADRRAVDDLFSRAGVPAKGKTRIVVCLSTSERRKEWPVERFVEVCNSLQKRYSLAFFLVGAGKEAEEMGQLFTKQVPDTYNFIGMTSLRQTGEIISRADLHLGGDTGTTHLAAACGLGGVVLYKDYPGAHPHSGVGAVNFFPWRAPMQVIRPAKALPGCEVECQAPEAHCIKQITVAEIIEKMAEEIERHEARA